jgi:hypothetical protein
MTDDTAKRIPYMRDDRELVGLVKRAIADKLGEYPADFQLQTGPSNEINFWTAANHGRHVRIKIQVLF